MMARYRVKAGTAEGKVLSRYMEAASSEELAISLEREGLFPIRVRSAGLRGLASSKISGVRADELMVFNQGLLTLLRAGLPLIEALDALRASSTKSRLGQVIAQVIEGLRAGQALSASMAAHAGVFPALYIATIAAGERTGDLVPSIKGYVEFQKRTEAIRKKVVSATVYPAVLALASFVVIAFLMVYVVPSFAGIYAGSGAELPLATALLIGASGFLREHMLAAIVLLAAAAAAARAGVATRRGAELLDRARLTAPLLGEIVRGYSVSKFSRTMAMLLKSGVQLPEALRMSRGVLNNAVLERALDKVVRKVIEGGSASAAMAEALFMPEITLRMFSAGERSASLQTMLDEIADYHDQDIDHRVGVLTSLIEPALMVIMGLVIGAIVLLMYLPIFQLGARV